jgi:hypothetical protein
LIVGLLLASASLLIRSDYCIGGDAWGWPAVVIHPFHGRYPNIKEKDKAYLWIALTPKNEANGRMLNFDNFIINVFCWGAASSGAFWIFKRLLKWWRKGVIPQKVKPPGVH